MGPRHAPLASAFMNGTIEGDGVWIPMDAILGGQEVRAGARCREGADIREIAALRRGAVPLSLYSLTPRTASLLLSLPDQKCGFGWEVTPFDLSARPPLSCPAPTE